VRSAGRPSSNTAPSRSHNGIVSSGIVSSTHGRPGRLRWLNAWRPGRAIRLIV
jgi:hypothetical protein